MKAVDHYIAALIGVMGDPDEWKDMSSYVETLHERAEAVARAACSHHGHDLVAEPDVIQNDVVWICDRCGHRYRREDADKIAHLGFDLEERETDASVLVRAGAAKKGAD